MQTQWKIADRTLDLRRPHLMGILNVTPDSFSDGGQYTDPTLALKRVEYYLSRDVFLIDVGGESSRPGATPISASEELNRLVPVVEAIVDRFPEVVLSVDTYHADTMRECLWRGVGWVNDIHALAYEPLALTLVAQSDVPVILMHNQSDAVYRDVVSDAIAFLQARKQAAIQAGVAPERIVVDPGFGFGKTREQNWEILRNIQAFSVLDAPILVGVSRKSMFAHLVPGPPLSRAKVSSAAAWYAALNGARFIRTHDVEDLQHYLLTWDDLML